jgi:signal transduction histidine kinase
MYRSHLKPSRHAFFIALAYFATVMVWILVSTWAIGRFATSTAEAQWFNILKGIAFAVIMSVALFVFARSVYTRIASNAGRLLQSHQRLLQAERQAIVGVLASSIAHDFSNVLTVMRLNLSRIESHSNLTGDTSESLKKLDRGLTRLTELTQRLRLSGRDSLPKEPTSFVLNDTVDETMKLLKTHATIQGCTIVVESEERVSLIGLPILVHQLLMNLILNAAEATKGKGAICVRLAREENAAVIEVHDDGPGIPEELREEIFNAFFTTKNAGSGLGLLSVNSCVAIHRGSIVVKTSPLGGALFEVRLADLTPSLNAEDKFSESLNKINLDQTTVAHSQATF